MPRSSWKRFWEMVIVGRGSTVYISQNRAQNPSEEGGKVKHFLLFPHRPNPRDQILVIWTCLHNHLVQGKRYITRYWKLLDLNKGIGRDDTDVFKTDVFETHSAVSVGEHPVLGWQHKKMENNTLDLLHKGRRPKFDFKLRFCPSQGETQICIKNESVHCREEGYIGLRNTSPSDLEISRGQGFYPPRPERLHKGEARGQFRVPRSAKSLHEGNLKVRVVKPLLEFFRKFIQMRTQASLRTKSQL